MLRLVANLEDLVAAAVRSLAIAGLSLLMLFATSTLVDGLMRGLANVPIEPVRDLGGLIVAVAITCCLPFGLWTRQNITITLVDKIVGPKSAQVLTAIAAIIVAVLMVAFASEMQAYARKLLRAREQTVMLGVPAAPFWYVIAALLWIAATVQICVAILDILHVAGRPQRSSQPPDTDLVL